MSSRNSGVWGGWSGVTGDQGRGEVRERAYPESCGLSCGFWLLQGVRGSLI